MRHVRVVLPQVVAHTVTSSQHYGLLGKIVSQVYFDSMQSMKQRPTRVFEQVYEHIVRNVYELLTLLRDFKFSLLRVIAVPGIFPSDVSLQVDRQLDDIR